MKTNSGHSLLCTLVRSTEKPGLNRIAHHLCRLRAIFRRDLVCLFLLTALLSACQSFSDKYTQSEAEISNVLVKQNLVGEDCRVQQVANFQQGKIGKRHFEIYCGRWEHASGHIFEVNSDDSSISLEQWANSGWWKQWLDRKLQCEQGAEDSILGEQNSLVLQCKLRNGDWPYLALAAKINGTTYLADGIPAVFPVLEDGIGVLAGLLSETSDSDGDSSSAAMQRIKTQFKGGLYGAGDLRTYFRLMKAGQFYNSIKDFTTAANRYREALAIHERIQGENNIGILDPLMHLALEMSNQGRFSEAEALFKKAAPLAERTTDQSDHARYLSYLALDAANKQKFEQALEYARLATQERRNLLNQQSNLMEMGVGQGSMSLRRERVGFETGVDYSAFVDIVQSLYIEAAMLQRLGKVEEAAKISLEAKSILRRANTAPPSWEPEVLGLTAGLDKLKGLKVERSKTLTVAVSLWEQFAPGERPSVLNYLKLGESYRDQNRMDDAMLAFKQAIKLVKSRSGSLSFDQLLPFFRTSIELAETRPDRKDQLNMEMFEAGQLIRGELTTQNIALSVARLAANQNAAGKIVRDYQEVQDERYSLYQSYEAEIAKPNTEDRNSRLQVLREKLSDIEGQISELGIQVQTAFPRYNQLVDSSVEAERVVELVKPTEALVQILLGTNEGMLFLIHGGYIKAMLIDLSLTEAEEIVSKLRVGVEPNADGTLPKYDVSLSYTLYRRLFSNLLDDIAVDHLITAPTGPLLSLPFGLLVTKEPPPVSGYDYRAIKWLAGRSAISLLPSVHSFVGLRDVAKSSQAAKAFIGYGDFKPFTLDELAKVDANISAECRENPERVKTHRQLLSRLSPLPNTKIEIEAVADSFEGATVDIVLGDDFTDGDIKSRALSDYKIVYFATHGLLPSELECQSQPSLVTSLPRLVNSDDDGLIDLDEIVGLRLNADLVVLSACNTGGSALKKGGEGLSGLARAFFFAGARSLVVSHWLAEDQSTTNLMIRMFKLTRGSGKLGWAKSLQLAQQSLIDEGRKSQIWRTHPFFWAAFTVVGDGAKGVSKI